MSELTLNDLPKTSLIWRASLRFSEMLRKITAVRDRVWMASRDRLRAEGEVRISQGVKPRNGSRRSAGVGRQRRRLHPAAARAAVWRLSCRRSPPA